MSSVHNNVRLISFNNNGCLRRDPLWPTGFATWIQNMSSMFTSPLDPYMWVGLVTIWCCSAVEGCLWCFCHWKTPWNCLWREGNFFPVPGFYLVTMGPKMLKATYGRLFAEKSNNQNVLFSSQVLDHVIRSTIVLCLMAAPSVTESIR